MKTVNLAAAALLLLMASTAALTGGRGNSVSFEIEGYPASRSRPPGLSRPAAQAAKRSEGDNNVRVEQRGPNLCGYALGSGEEILINMKHEDTKWVGRIHDPKLGRNCESIIVQGFAFGGLFCGGQTWKRVS